MPLNGRLEALFPAPLDDVRTAIGWVRDNAGSYRLDHGRVFLWGEAAATWRCWPR